MRHTYQIRRYISLTSAVALSAFLLIGCTRADSGSSSQNSSAAQGAIGQSTVAGTTDQTLAGAGSQTTDTSASTQQTAAAQDVSGQTTQTAQSVSGTTTTTTADTTDGTQAVQTQTSAPKDMSQNQSPDQGDEATLTDEDLDAIEASPEVFSGEYNRSDGTESVIVSLVDGSTVSFAFSASGISSLAQVTGSNTAVYEGEDGYVITFDFAGTTLGVSTASPDGSGSSMDGIYERVVEGGDSVDEVDDESYDGEDSEEDVYMDADTADEAAEDFVQ